MGPAAQSYGYGFGISEWGGSVTGSATSTLNGGIVAADTTIALTDASSFTASNGQVLIGNFSSGDYASTSELVNLRCRFYKQFNYLFKRTRWNNSSIFNRNRNYCY